MAEPGDRDVGTGGMEGLPNYEEDLVKCREFLLDFATRDGRNKYSLELVEIADRERNTLIINLEDVLAFRRDEEFVNR
jgi:hypothetical protein